MDCTILKVQDKTETKTTREGIFLSGYKVKSGPLSIHSRDDEARRKGTGTKKGVHDGWNKSGECLFESDSQGKISYQNIECPPSSSSFESLLS